MILVARKGSDQRKTKREKKVMIVEMQMLAQ